MTIKRYLFLLFSALILTIAITQITLLYVFKSNIDQEIDKRGRDFADLIVNFAVENLDSVENADSKQTSSDRVSASSDVVVIDNKPQHSNMDFVVIEVEQEANKQRLETVFEVPSDVIKQEQQLQKAIAELPPEVQNLVMKLSKKFTQTRAKRVKGKQQDFEIKIFKPRSSHRHNVKQRLKHQIDRFTSAQTYYRKEMVLKEGGIVQRDKTWMPFHRGSHRETLINKMFNVIFVLIAVTTLVALLLVFWLSRKFSQPLQQLSNGFKQLENGEFGIKVKPQGVEEVKQTINRFNTMSDQLVKLAEAEHKLMQQTQLTELSDVSKGIAHALRNPMHTIGLAIEQLSQEDVPEPLKQKLFAKVQSKLAQLDKNIKALLTVTSGEIERNQPVVLLSVLQDIVLELKQSHQLSEIELKVLLEVSSDIQFIGSDKEIRSVLHTLVFNAYEACVEANKSLIKIEIKGYADADKVVLSITDNGAGIDEKIMARMFEPHNSSKAEGAGMGLYISKRIIELYYAGRLSIENNIIDEQPIGVTAEVEFNIKTNQE